MWNKRRAWRCRRRGRCWASRPCSRPPSDFSPYGASTADSGGRFRISPLASPPSRRTPRTSPSLRALTRPGRAGDLPLVFSQLDGLVSCYRRALDEVVRAQELLEKVRKDDASRGAADDSLGPTRYLGAGARRRMIARLAPNLHWIAATTPLQHFIGKPIVDLVARSFLDVVHPEDAPALQASLQESLKDGEGHDITFRVLTPGKPGRKRSLRGDSGLSLVESHLLMDVMTCYSEAGAPLNLRCHLLDVTERVLTERELPGAPRSCRRPTSTSARSTATSSASRRATATSTTTPPSCISASTAAAGSSPATKRWCGRWGIPARS